MVSLFKFVCVVEVGFSNFLYHGGFKYVNYNVFGGVESVWIMCLLTSMEFPVLILIIFIYGFCFVFLLFSFEIVYMGSVIILFCYC